ncbi:F-actin-capping protein subunit alpha [Entophlyctis helioformis]|nr:F-actin-capping protein subunit alpha [Entophlyctis helioformis]
MSTEAERVAIAAGFLKDSPPGEINDVFNDVRALVANDSLLQESIPAAFEEHNAEQFATVTPPGKDYQVILGKHGHIDGSRFLDPRSGQILTVDQVHLTVSHVESHESQLARRLLDYRSALEHAAIEYAAAFFPSSAVTVWATEDEALVLGIVANKYNPDSFWSGRWRSQWRIQPGAKELTGFAKIQVHYYEDGNVQLNSSKDYAVNVDAPEDPAAFATVVVKQISKLEAEYQLALNENHNRLSSASFKSLRRALPLTRSKIEWQSILSYKVGAELSSR